VPAGKADASRRPRRRPSCGRGCAARAGGLAGRACGRKRGEGTRRTAPCDQLGSVRKSPRDSRRILRPLSGLDLLLTQRPLSLPTLLCGFILSPPASLHTHTYARAHTHTHTRGYKFHWRKNDKDRQKALTSDNELKKPLPLRLCAGT